MNDRVGDQLAQQQRDGVGEVAQLPGGQGAGDETARRRILVDNPASLFAF